MKKTAIALAVILASNGPLAALDNGQIPLKLPLPFANSAGPSYIRQIPVTSQIGIQAGAASLTDGFPPVTFLPVGAGGVPPFGQDLNGILSEISAWVRWQAAGGPVYYDSAFATAVGGYPDSAIVSSAGHPGCLWISNTNNNTTDPDAGGAGWINTCAVGGVLTGLLPSPGMAAGAAATNVGPLGGVLTGTLPSPGMTAGAASTNIGTLGGVLTGTLPSPGLANLSVTAAKIASGAAASNVGTLGGVLGGTLPNPTMASGAAATNVGALGGDLTGTLPSPTLTTSGVSAGNYFRPNITVDAKGRLTAASNGGQPTTSVFSTAGSGTYTVPGGTRRIYVRMIGGGGGGGGNGSASQTNGATGGTTVLGSISIVGGSGGAASSGGSGGGGGLGGNSGMCPGLVCLIGGNGGNGASVDPSGIYFASGIGGNGMFGGGGAPGTNTTNENAAPNTGGGAAGAFSSLSSIGAGGGGGAGEYVEFQIATPSLSASYAYTVAAGGVAGAAGTSGNAGGTGGTGLIIIQEFYD